MRRRSQGGRHFEHEELSDEVQSPPAAGGDDDNDDDDASAPRASDGQLAGEASGLVGALDLPASPGSVLDAGAALPQTFGSDPAATSQSKGVASSSSSSASSSNSGLPAFHAAGPPPSAPLTFLPPILVASGDQRRLQSSDFRSTTLLAPKVAEIPPSAKTFSPIDAPGMLPPTPRSNEGGALANANAAGGVVGPPLPPGGVAYRDAQQQQQQQQHAPLHFSQQSAPSQHRYIPPAPGTPTEHSDEGSDSEAPPPPDASLSSTPSPSSRKSLPSGLGSGAGDFAAAGALGVPTGVPVRRRKTSSAARESARTLALAKKSACIVSNLEAAQQAQEAPSTEALRQRNREKAEAEEERRIAIEEKAIRHRRTMLRNTTKINDGAEGGGGGKGADGSSSSEDNDARSGSDYDGGEDSGTGPDGQGGGAAGTPDALSSDDSGDDLRDSLGAGGKWPTTNMSKKGKGSTALLSKYVKADASPTNDTAQQDRRNSGRNSDTRAASTSNAATSSSSSSSSSPTTIPSSSSSKHSSSAPNSSFGSSTLGSAGPLCEGTPPMGQCLNGAPEQLPDITLRILLLGDSGVGKTSLMMRYSDDKFAYSLIATAGVDFKVKNMDIPNPAYNKSAAMAKDFQQGAPLSEEERELRLLLSKPFLRVRCQIWDTAGQEKFHVITRAYYRGAHAIVTCFDVTDSDSFKNIDYWLANIHTHTIGNANESERVGVQTMIIGNKTDLHHKRAVSKEQAENLAKECGVKYIETSAKSGTNVNEAFQMLATDVVVQMDRERRGAGVPPNAAGKKPKRWTLTPNFLKSGKKEDAGKGGGGASTGNKGGAKTNYAPQQTKEADTGKRRASESNCAIM